MMLLSDAWAFILYCIFLLSLMNVVPRLTLIPRPLLLCIHWAMVLNCVQILLLNVCGIACTAASPGLHCTQLQ